MRSLITTFVFLILLLPGFGQDWQWGNSITSDGNVEAYDIVSDAAQNVYIVGVVTDATSFTIGTDTYTIKGDWDAFICSFSADGNYRWSRQMAGIGRDDVKALAMDQYDSIYVIGAFKDATIYFTPGDSLENFNHYDSYIAKYATNGDLSYVKRAFWGTNQQRIQDIEVNEVKEEIAVVGTFKDQLIYFNGVTDITLPVVGTKDLFVATFSYDSVFKDIVVYNTTDKASSLKNIVTCTAGGYFVTGDLRGRINFSGGDFIEGEAVNSDALIFRVDDNLDYLWSRLGRGAAYDHVNWAVSDKYSNVYITGKTESNPTTFDSTATLPGTPLASFGGPDLYIAKYNRSGILQWAKRNGDSGNDNAYGADVSSELLYVIGNFAGTIIFGQDTIKTGSITNVDVGLAVMDVDGNPISWSKVAGTLEDIGTGLVASGPGDVTLTGYFASPVLTAGSIDLNNASSPNTDGFVLNYNFPYTATFSKIQNITCNGGSDGELIVTPHFGQTPFSYAWDHNPALNDSTATGLLAGFYRVVITDDNSQTTEASITLTEPAVISVSETITNVDCFGSNTGAIDVEISGGVAPYSYAWSGPGSFTSVQEDISSLYAGSYTINITDASGCTGQGIISVGEPLEIVFTGTSVTDIVRPPGSNGAANLNVSGGVPSYSYNWEFPLGVSISTNEDLSGIDIGGQYFVFVTDQNGCVSDTNVIISDDFVCYIDSVKNISCVSGSDGYLRVATDGGTAPFSYDWRDVLNNPVGINSPVLSGVPAGFYSVTVTDFTTKTSQSSYTLTEPALAISVVPETITNISCFGDDDGYIEVNTSGGTPPYSWAWTGPSGYTASSEDIYDLGPGFYSLTATDANGCIATLPGLEIEEPSLLSVSIGVPVSEPLCFGDLTGELCATVAGGTAPFNFLWDDPGSQVTQCADFLDGGNYTVVVTDLNGCEAQDNQDIDEPTEISISGQINHISCGNITGDIIATIGGGTPAYSYVWYDELSAIVGTTKDLLGQAAGTYTLEVTDANNCMGVYIGTILQLSNLEVTNIDTANCSIRITATGGQRPYQYSMDGGMIYQVDSLFSDLNSGDYSVWVKDATDCEVDGGITNLVDCNDLEILTIDTSNCSIRITAIGGQRPYQYSIDDGMTYLADSLFSNLNSGSYSVWVKDALNLEVDGGIVNLVGCNESSELEIFSAFSPNDDAWNNVWNIPGIMAYPNCVVKVFNSWGTAVFISPVGYPEPWDGSLNSGGKIVPAGTYYYVIDLGDGSDILSGTVNVVK